MSFFWASRFERAHSRQKRCPWEGQDTGSRAGNRQRRQEPKGRKESRVSRVDFEPQVPFSSARSWAVKKASDVLCLPFGISVECYREIRRRRTMRHDGRMWIGRSRVDCEREKNAVIECGARRHVGRSWPAKFGMLNNVSPLSPIALLLLHCHALSLVEYQQWLLLTPPINRRCSGEPVPPSSQVLQASFAVPFLLA
jgi:hypothetical protein